MTETILSQELRPGHVLEDGRLVVVVTHPVMAEPGRAPNIYEAVPKTRAVVAPREAWEMWCRFDLDTYERLGPEPETDELWFGWLDYVDVTDA